MSYWRGDYHRSFYVFYYWQNLSFDPNSFCTVLIFIGSGRKILPLSRNTPYILRFLSDVTPGLRWLFFSFLWTNGRVLPVLKFNFSRSFVSRNFSGLFSPLSLTRAENFLWIPATFLHLTSSSFNYQHPTDLLAYYFAYSGPRALCIVVDQLPLSAYMTEEPECLRKSFHKHCLILFLGFIRALHHIFDFLNTASMSNVRGRSCTESCPNTMAGCFHVSSIKVIFRQF